MISPKYTYNPDDKSIIVGCFITWFVGLDGLILISTHGKNYISWYLDKYKNYEFLHTFTNEDDAKKEHERINKLV